LNAKEKKAFVARMKKGKKDAAKKSKKKETKKQRKTRMAKDFSSFTKADKKKVAAKVKKSVPWINEFLGIKKK
jgi:hypothetical protein